jgi:hypothetical protein
MIIVFKFFLAEITAHWRARELFPVLASPYIRVRFALCIPPPMILSRDDSCVERY